MEQSKVNFESWYVFKIDCWLGLGGFTCLTVENLFVQQYARLLLLIYVNEERQQAKAALLI